MTADMSVISLLWEASMPVQIVMIILMGASLMSWSIIFTKRRLIRRTKDASDEFEAAFWSGGDLNTLYRECPALYEVDFSENGFEWLDWDDKDNSVLSWVRRDSHGGYVICVSNFTPVSRSDFRIGVPENRALVEALNTDDQRYGGSNFLNETLRVENIPCHGQEFSTSISLPPLASLILRPAE